MQKYYLKKANVNDLDLLYKWANDAAVRNSSFNEAPISYQEHKQWFANKLTSKNCDIFIYYFDNIPIGQIRFDYTETQAEIDYSIENTYRRKSHGRNLLYLGEQEVINKQSIEILYAKVKQSNIASQKKFEQAGYIKETMSEAILVYKKRIKENKW